MVNMRQLNAATLRQTHYTEPPFSQASGVPPGTWRFTSDAWNGYHSVPIDARDRHLTTFLTPWGRMRYLAAPQGSLSSGDGFTYWYDMVMRNMPRKKKCIDDVLGWADDLDQLFEDVCLFLTHTARHGIIQNTKKFKWGRWELEYMGFWLKEDRVRPSDDTLAAIRDFPWPTDITGIRSWYGLVEQVAFAFSKTAVMEPFRGLLKKDSVYAWTPELQSSFEVAREEIVTLVKKGVQSFVIGAHTCLVTDWSKSGVGFVLWQKRCGCSKIHPTCCPTGWVMILCGSRYCTPAESRYHPIEGELLGVAWSLEKTRLYTLGCEKLLILVDHKPLLGLLTRRELGDIDNPRLEQLAERLLRWTFKIEHVAGAKNFAPDALSRSPGPHRDGPELGALGVQDEATESWSRALEGEILATAIQRSNLVVPWDTLQKAGIANRSYAGLLHALSSGEEDLMWDKELLEYKRHRDERTQIHGVVMFLGRVVVPAALR